MATKSMRDLIFVKLDNENVLAGRRELLEGKIDSLNILKSLRNYKALRMKELEKKNMLRLKLNRVKNNLKILTGILPKVEMNLARIEKEVGKMEKNKEEKSDFAVERELREIKAELEKLER